MENNVKKIKQISDRLSRVIGQLNGIKRMIEEKRECIDVLIQMSAATSALDSTSKLILQDYVNNCIQGALEKNDKDAVNNLNSILSKFL